MHVIRIPLGAPELRLLQQLNHSPAFDKLVECIRAEFSDKLFEAKVDLASFLFEEHDDNVDAKVKFKEAARLKCCLDVLDEFLAQNKELYTIKVEA